MKKTAKVATDALVTAFQRTSQVRVEALVAIWHRMPFGQTLELSNGKTAVITAVGEPDVSEADGSTLGFMFDLAYTDGSGHLEYYVKATGWGGMP